MSELTILAKLGVTLAKFGIKRLGSAQKILNDGRAQNIVDREKQLLIAQTEEDIKKIKLGELSIIVTNNGPKLVSTHQNIDDSDDGRIEPTIGLINQASTNMVLNQLQKDINIENTINIAEEVLRQDHDEPSEREVDNDWLFRWREHASRVSSDELQKIWGHVLAGEVKEPGSYSIRTLEFLNSISKSDAELIVKVSELILNDYIFKVDKYYELFGVSFDQFLYLDEIGFLQSVDSISLSVDIGNILSTSFLKTLGKEQNVYVGRLDLNQDEIILFGHENKKENFRINIIALSVIGREVMKIIDPKPSINTLYIGKIIEHIKSQGYEVRLVNNADFNNEINSLFEKLIS